MKIFRYLLDLVLRGVGEHGAHQHDADGQEPDRDTEQRPSKYCRYVEQILSIQDDWLTSDNIKWRLKGEIHKKTELTWNPVCEKVLEIEKINYQFPRF